MEKKVLKLAPNGKRIAAYLIDAVVPLIFSALLIAALVIFGNESGYDDSMSGFYDPFGMYGFDSGMGVSEGTEIALIVGILIMSLVYLAYLIVQIVFYTKSKTIGKAIMGLQVVSSKNGEPVGIWWMLLREWIAKDVSGAAFLIGYIWILIDDKKRAWHDKICDTYVVEYKKENNEEQV